MQILLFNKIENKKLYIFANFKEVVVNYVFLDRLQFCYAISERCQFSLTKSWVLKPWINIKLNHRPNKSFVSPDTGTCFVVTDCSRASE